MACSAPSPLPTITLALPDGSTVQARPVHPDDKPLLVSGFERLSARSRSMRFQGAAERLDDRRLRYLTEVDHRDHVAWGVLDGTDAVAVGRWIRLEDRRRADVAVTVLDDHQGRGIGTLLVQLLALSARHREVTSLEFEMLAENQPMIRVVERLGGTVVHRGREALGSLEVASVPPPPVVDGDPVALLDAAAQPRSGSNSNANELTQ